MRISTKGRYAVRLMVCIEREQSDGPVAKQILADREELSADYVEQILVVLKNAGLVHSHRGAKGGFTLGRRADEINVWDVLTAVEGPMHLAPCQGESEACGRNSFCATREVWAEAYLRLGTYLRGISIRDLASRADQLQSEQVPSYMI